MHVSKVTCTRVQPRFYIFVEVPVSFCVVLHLSLSPWHNYTAPPSLKCNSSRPWTLRECSHEEETRKWGGGLPAASIQTLCSRGQDSRCLWPAALDKNLNRLCCVCVWMYFLELWCTRVLCVISEVLNDLCSMCNWAALPEIRVGLTLKLSLILGRLQWAGLTRQDGDLTQVRESKAALSALFKCQADVKCFYQYLWSLTAYFIPEWHVWTNKCRLHICQYYI